MKRLDAIKAFVRVRTDKIWYAAWVSTAGTYP